MNRLLPHPPPNLRRTPVGANGALITLTVTGASGSGFPTAYSNGLTPYPATSSLNFTGGQDIGTKTVVAVTAQPK